MNSRKFTFFLIGLVGLTASLIALYFLQFSNSLINSRWQLEKFVIDGISTTEYASGQWIQFERNNYSGFDNCNQISGNYEAKRRGSLRITSFIQTLKGCMVVNAESGETTSLGDKEFNEALQAVVFYEIKNNQLWLYYPQDKSNSLVFSPQSTLDE